MSTKNWKIVKAANAASNPDVIIDGREDTLWNTHAASGEIPPPQEVEIDMGKDVPVATVFYTPRKDNTTRGIADKYEIYVSKDGKNWGKAVAAGEFSNIKANPIRQRIDLKTPATGRYLKFVVTSVVEGNHVTIAELGVLPKKSDKK